MFPATKERRVRGFWETWAEPAGRWRAVRIIIYSNLQGCLILQQKQKHTHTQIFFLPRLFLMSLVFGVWQLRWSENHREPMRSHIWSLHLLSPRRVTQLHLLLRRLDRKLHPDYSRQKKERCKSRNTVSCRTQRAFSQDSFLPWEAEAWAQWACVFPKI